MVDVSKVGEWVLKAVADIAAFEGNLRKVDTDSEKNALSTLLAGSNNLTQEEKDYIEGFMLDKSGKTEKINGLKPKKNEARTVEVPYTEPLGASNQEENDKKSSISYPTAKPVITDEEKKIAGEGSALNDKELNSSYLVAKPVITDEEKKIAGEGSALNDKELNSSYLVVKPVTTDEEKKIAGEGSALNDKEFRLQ